MHNHIYHRHRRIVSGNSRLIRLHYHYKKFIRRVAQVRRVNVIVIGKKYFIVYHFPFKLGYRTEKLDNTISFAIDHSLIYNSSRMCVVCHTNIIHSSNVSSLSRLTTAPISGVALPYQSSTSVTIATSLTSTTTSVSVSSSLSYPKLAPSWPRYYYGHIA